MKTANVLGLAMTVALAACSGQSAPEAAAKPAAEPAATSSAAAPASADAATATTAPAAAAPVGDARSLCAAGDDVVISCKVAGGAQLLSLCASKGVSDQSGTVYFAQGEAGKPDYVFPADKSAPAGRFKRTQLGFAGNTGGYAYSFEDGGRKRIFYSVSGERGLEEQGVLTVAGDADKAESALGCEPGSVVRNEDDALFKFTRSWDRDERIDQHGLPAKR
ncbi:hypothetical protein RDV84_18385 [Lysobacter yananisis]|uniref:Lipoprotein n=2 Tax=Lysobacter TaxID=68 RepID=A0A0S2DHQ4_LYSEN|nr:MULTISPECIES: hypothetical protein [Lysobacter]ALN58155.1 lipoprotein [Lysobacter enzymogenes]WMT01916.1 hypothetical protein RDV84_18385 [Lysobacter yananisis]